MTGQMLTNIMSVMGRGGDDTIGHLSRGDVVIPREAVLKNPDFLTKLKKVMSDNNSDYRTHVVGSGYENKNPHTGAPEFNWFSNAFHSVTKPIEQAISPITNVLAPALSPGFLGGLLGGGSSSSAPSSASPTAALPAPDLGATSQEFTPKRPDAAVQPFGLFNSSVGGQQFSTLDPTQQRSYLATQGTQGGGIGDEAKNYYLNLLQRNLIDENGQQQNINSALLPIERNYLSRLGLPTGNTADFLKAVQQPALPS